MSGLNLEIPNGLTGDALIRFLNDRMRTIAQALPSDRTAGTTANLNMGGYRIVVLGDPLSPQDALNQRTADARYATRAALKSVQESKPSGGSTTPSASSGQLILSVPGTLATQANAAALVELGADTTFTSAVALIKGVPLGGSNVLTINAGTGQLGTVTIGAGQSSVSVSASSWAAVPKNTVLTVDVLVGALTFPGSDLTLILRF